MKYQRDNMSNRNCALGIAFLARGCDPKGVRVWGKEFPVREEIGGHQERGVWRSYPQEGEYRSRNSYPAAGYAHAFGGTRGGGPPPGGVPGRGGTPVILQRRELLAARLFLFAGTELRASPPAR